MNPKHANNCEELRSRFEGREALYVDKGVLRVRVNNISSGRGFVIRADVEEIATAGLGVGMFHRPPLGAGPLPRSIAAGYLTTFSAQCWQMGYGGWSLYFSPEIVQAVAGFAARFPENADPNEGYKEVCRLLMELNAYEPTRLVFSDAVCAGSGKFRMSDSPAIAVQASSGWVVCPYCGKRFTLSDSRRWDGERHTTCGQRLAINTA